MATISRNPAQARDRPGVDTAHGDPETLPFGVPDPGAASVIVIHTQFGGQWRTFVSRVFVGGRGEACRICPRSLCGLQRLPGGVGHCQIQIGCYVPDESARAFPLLADSGLAGPAPRPDRMADLG